MTLLAWGADSVAESHRSQSPNEGSRVYQRQCLRRGMPMFTDADDYDRFAIDSYSSFSLRLVVLV